MSEDRVQTIWMLGSMASNGAIYVATGAAYATAAIAQDAADIKNRTHDRRHGKQPTPAYLVVQIPIIYGLPAATEHAA